MSFTTIKRSISDELRDSSTVSSNNTDYLIIYKVVVSKGRDGCYIAQSEDFPEAITQAKTWDKLRENITEAIELVLEDKFGCFHSLTVLMEEE
jgi:predicted RNase H-like HicB family nuclease